MSLTPADVARLRAAGGGDAVGNRFEILLEAGRGGMGTVYRARDRSSDETVAVKIMRDGTEVDGARFEREAQILSTLDHPRIVRYLAHGKTPDDEPFIAMEWLEGVTLSKYLHERGALPWRDVALLGAAICEGLDGAHGAGLIHRDLKPANLFLVGSVIDDVRLLDFGIARIGGGEDGPTGLTRTGELLGTAGYLAPEQARGSDAIDARADLFSLGCVLYRALTGAAPFGGEHVLDALGKLLTLEPPPVSQLASEVPARLEALIHRLLAKTPDGRPATAAATRDELRDIVSAPGPMVRPSRPVPKDPARTARETTRRQAPRPWRAIAIAAALTVVALSVGAAIRWGRAPDEPAASATPTSPAPVARSTSEVAREACTEWASSLAAMQQADGSFGIERHRASMGWATAQAAYALAMAEQRCAPRPDVTSALDRALTALERFVTTDGVSGDELGSAAQTGATAWGLLALSAAHSRPGVASTAIPALRTGLASAAASDGGLCAHPNCTVAGSVPYLTVLGAWALSRDDDDGDTSDHAIAWLDARLGDPTSELARIEGLTEQAAWVALEGHAPHSDAWLARIARQIVAECGAEDGGEGPRCRRGPGRAGATYLDAEGPGPNLVTFWFPWTVALAHRLTVEEHPQIDAALRTELARVVTASIGRFEDGLDLLEAAPSYECAEFVVMASLLAAP